MYKNILIILAFIFSCRLMAQDSIGYIKIYGLDKRTKKPIQDSFTVDFNNGAKTYKLKPDSDGYVGIKYLTANKYSVALSVQGYQTLQYNKVIINGIHTTYLSFPLTSLADVKTGRRKRKTKCLVLT